MPISGFVDYRRREYCRDVRCPVQLELESCASGSPEYERVRARCKQACLHTTWEFHHWLIEHDYQVVRPEP